MEGWILKECWKRLGFKNIQNVRDSVRKLPLEDKVEMLTELFMRELTIMHVNRKKEFLLSLGHKTWVDSEEIYEEAKRTYTDSDDVTWVIDKHMQSYELDKSLWGPAILNAAGLKQLEDKRKGKKK